MASKRDCNFHIITSKTWEGRRDVAMYLLREKMQLVGGRIWQVETGDNRVARSCEKVIIHSKENFTCHLFYDALCGI